MKKVAHLMRVEVLERRTLLAASVGLVPLGTFDHGGFDEGAAEIVTYDPESQRLFVINAQADTVDILRIKDPSRPRLVGVIDTSAIGSPNSVAVKNGLVAVALEVKDEDRQLPGKVAFYKTSGEFINALTVGALPDMVTFSPDGKNVLLANEGEPNGDYTHDPEGSVSIVNVGSDIRQIRRLTDADVRTASFASFNDQKAALIADGVRIYGPGASVAQDLEPEYIAVSPDGSTAYVTLQENNALALVDIATATVTEIVPLGYKDYRIGNNRLDASDRDNAINIAHWPVLGMYQPDAISAFSSAGQNFLITVNEGDAREYDPGLVEQARVGTLTLDPTAFPNAADLKKNANLGRLRVTKSHGDTDGDGDYDQLYTFGGRSFSILDAAGNLVFDSGDEMERITSERLPNFFNSPHDENAKDGRSDDKGPEPEAVTTGVVNGVTYAFIGLERIGGVMVYDLSNPASPKFVEYVNNRDFTKDVQTPEAGDLGPECVLFISAEQSPTGSPLLVVSNEVSGTTTVYAVTTPDAPAEPATEAVVFSVRPVTGAELAGNDELLGAVDEAVV